MNRYGILGLWLSCYLGVLCQDAYGGGLGYMLGLILGIACCWPKLWARYRAAALLFLAFCFGALWHLLSQNTKPNLSENTDVRMVFHVQKKLNSSAKSYKYIAEVEAISDPKNNERFRILIYQPKKNGQLLFGQSYTASAKLMPIAPPSHSFLFDYQKYMARQNVFYKSQNLQLTQTKNQDFGPELWFRLQRQKHEQNIQKSILSDPAKELMKALVLGDRANLQTEITQDFTQAGLAHLLAISGGHILLIYFFVLWILRRILFIKNQTTSIAIAILAVWFYAALIDFGPAITRACLMLSFYFGFKIFDRKPDALHALALSGIVLLCADSQQAFSLSYQLSFAAVLGILLFMPILSAYIKSQNKHLENLLLIPLKISLAAQIGTLPLVLYYFHQYPLVSLLSNILFMLWSEFLLIISGIYIFLFAWISPWTWMGQGIDFLYQKTIWGIHFLGQNPKQVWQNIACSGPEALLMALLIGLLYLYKLEQKISRLIYAGFVFVSLCFLHLYLDYNSSQKNETISFKHDQGEVIVHRQGRYLQVFSSTTLSKKQLEDYYLRPYAWHIRAGRHYYLEGTTSSGER